MDTVASHQHRRRLLVRLFAVVFLLALTWSAGVSAQNANESRSPSAVALESVFTRVAEAASSSVVAIHVESQPDAGHRDRTPLGFPFGAGNDRDDSQVQRGIGSGVVIRADGYVLTNRHVVEGATRVEVVFKDGSQALARIIGIDDATDLAVVKVDRSRLDAAHFADSDRAKPGQWVVAVGSPFGLDYTVTVGVLSAVGRTGTGTDEIEDYLQTDASINPGNSGGPLVNLDGEVLGINTMILGRGTGIGFAIPSSLARMVANQLIVHGSFRRAYIGVGSQSLTPELAKHFGHPSSRGVLVNSVVDGSPADRAGIRVGDIIVSLDDESLTENRDLLRTLLRKPVGAKLSLGVMRANKEEVISLTTVERADEKRPHRNLEPNARRGAGAALGLGLEALDRRQASRLGYTGLKGALIVFVARASPAERAGLVAGDLIVEADRKPVDAPKDVVAAFDDGNALLRVQRGYDATYLVLSRE